MPRKNTHKKISKIVLGRDYGEVDALIDWPVRFLGKSHRKLNHTLVEAIVIGFLASGEARGAAAGALHIVVDVASTFLNKQIINGQGKKNGGKKSRTKKVPSGIRSKHER
jgi:hypothetical protein